MRLGVFGRFLIISVSACLIVFAGGIAAFNWNNHRTAQTDLGTKMDSLVGVYALILAEPLATKRYDQVELYSVGLLVDKEVAGFIITDPAGNNIQTFGEFDPVARFAKTAIIRFADEAGIKEVGKISLSMSTKALDKKSSRLIFAMILILAGILLISLACSSYAYWQAVGRPLKRLTGEIRRFQKEGVHRDVEIGANDQLGEVIGEYNRMQKLAEQQRNKLISDHRLLEEESRKQSEQLHEEHERYDFASKQMAFMASRDPLTELPNRRFFQEHVSMWLLDHEHKVKSGAICFINLDELKAVNNAGGYYAGDTFLISAAKLIEVSVQGVGFLARISGDEFALFIADTNIDGVTGHCQSLVEAFSKHHFEWGEHRFAARISIGVYMLEGNTSYDEALKNADLACEMAKSSGGNCWQIGLNQTSGVSGSG